MFFLEVYEWVVLKDVQMGTGTKAITSTALLMIPKGEWLSKKRGCLVGGFSCLKRWKNFWKKHVDTKKVAWKGECSNEKYKAQLRASYFLVYIWNILQFLEFNTGQKGFAGWTLEDAGLAWLEGAEMNIHNADADQLFYRQVGLRHHAPDMMLLAFG